MDQKERSREVALTILNQLGGNKFKAMVAAYNVSCGFNSLNLAFRGSKKANCVTIALTARDDYMVNFYHCTAKHFKEVARYDGIYCDGLKEIFEKVTGLYTSL